MREPATVRLDTEAVRRALRPPPELDDRIRAFIGIQLGRVLPPRPDRGLGWYYDSVVLGTRSLDAYSVLQRHRSRLDGPVLDVGSGLGTFVLLANHLGTPAIGVEPGEEEHALAEQRGRAMDPPVEGVFRNAPGEALPVDDESVSAVLLHDVLEHVRDWRRVLRESIRVLVPGGVIYVKGPSYSARLVEPHYRVPWLPFLPRAVARPYLSALGRDVDYLGHLGFRRRGEVLSELRALGLRLTFPRLDKLHEPGSITRPWPRLLAGSLKRADGRLLRLVEPLAENPLQWAIDVVGHKPAGRR